MYRVLIWGTGLIATECENNGINAEIVGYIETQKRADFYKNKKIYEINEIPDDYDFIIIANNSANQIKQVCENANIDMTKVIFVTYLLPFHGYVDKKIILSLFDKRTVIRYMNDLISIDETFFAEDLIEYNKINTRESFIAEDKNLYPVVTDRYADAGAMNNYLLQDLWAAKKVKNSGVLRHYDIGSRVDGFITHILAMNIIVTMIDIREYPNKLENLEFIQADATTMDTIPDNSIESLSALCSLEHFGLGRYGDPIDPEACFKCFDAIQKKIKKGGNLYIAVPVGRERVEFNAHRIFYASTIESCFYDMDLLEYSCAKGNEIDYNIDNIHKYDDYNIKGCGRFGLFHFKKK